MVYQELSSHRIMKNEEADYELIIENAGFIKINDCLLVFEDRLCDISKFELFSKNIRKTPYGLLPCIGLGPLEKEVHKGRLSCRYAGTYDIGLVGVVLTDPFGIYMVKCQGVLPFRANVLPKVSDMAGSLIDFENLKNSSKIKSTYLREEVLGNDMRPYVSGDPLKMINWKVSASAGELMSRIPENIDLNKVWMILVADPDAMENRNLEYIKRRDCFLEFAVSAVWMHAEKGESIRIIYPRGEIKDKEVNNPESYLEFYEDLSRGPFYNKPELFDDIREYHRRSKEYEEGCRIITIWEALYGTADFISVGGDA